MEKRIKSGVHAGREKPVVRKYYGCLHCKSLALKRLSTTSGDPEGIREDYECLVCGGVFGCCKSHFTEVHESEWEGDWPMPRPNRNKVFAMQLLVALEEQYGFRFRSKEIEVAETVSTLIETHHASLLKRNQALQERLEAVRVAAK